MGSTGNSERWIVWVVEDNAEFGRQLQTLLNLSDLFWCDRTFTSCEPALALLRDDELPDLVLMDIGLPGMGGIEGIRQMKEFAPSLDVVILTVFEDVDTILKGITAGASGYLVKSSSLDAIVDSLRAIRSGGAPMNPQIARKLLTLFPGPLKPSEQYGLSPRERQILTMLVEGLVKKEIAANLGVSFHTIDHHLRNIYSKLQVQSRTSAVAKALKERLL